MYDELIKRLKDSEHEIDCSLCDRYCCYPDGKVHGKCIIIEAADAIEELVRKEKFHTFLWNVINPNEMEQYIEMYNSKGIPVCGFPEPPKEEI